MSPRRQKLLARVNWFHQSSLKHITEQIPGNKFYFKGGRYRQVSLYMNLRLYVCFLVIFDTLQCCYLYIWPSKHPLIAKSTGPKWGPSGVDRTQVGPHVGLMNLALWVRLWCDFNTLLEFSGRSDWFWLVYWITYWGRVTHIFVSKLYHHWFRYWLVSYTAPNHYLNQCWDIVSWTTGTNCSDIIIEIQTFSFKKMHLKMSSGKWRPFCLGLNVIMCAESLGT